MPTMSSNQESKKRGILTNPTTLVKWRAGTATVRESIHTPTEMYTQGAGYRTNLMAEATTFSEGATGTRDS